MELTRRKLFSNLTAAVSATVVAPRVIAAFAKPAPQIPASAQALSPIREYVPQSFHFCWQQLTAQGLESQRIIVPTQCELRRWWITSKWNWIDFGVKRNGEMLLDQTLAANGTGGGHFAKPIVLRAGDVLTVQIRQAFCSPLDAKRLRRPILIDLIG